MSARASLRDIDRPEDKKNFLPVHHQARPSLPLIDAIPRQLQEEMRHSPVDRDSARMLDQEMKKRPSKSSILLLFSVYNAT